MIRFLADADLNDAIVSGCLRREPTMDFLSANNADLEGVPDPEVLAIAADQDRILVSHEWGIRLTQVIKLAAALVGRSPWTARDAPVPLPEAEAGASARARAPAPPGASDCTGLSQADTHLARFSDCAATLWRVPPGTRFSPGVFLVQQYSPIGDVIEDLVLVWAASDAEEWKNRILNVPLS